MARQVAHRRVRLVLLATIASAGLLFYVSEQRRQQSAGVCKETGQRLSDAQILHIAQGHVGPLAAANSRSQGPDARFPLRIVPETALRAEEKVPDWVKNTGGYRAYVGFANDKGALSDQYGRPYWLVVSNCGDFRNAADEYFGGWFW